MAANTFFGIKFGCKLVCSLNLQLLSKKLAWLHLFWKYNSWIAYSYVLNTHVKFRVNWMLIIIQSINLFFMHNLKLHNLFCFKKNKKRSQRKKKNNNNNSNSNINNKPSHSYLLVFNFLHFNPFSSFLTQLISKA